MSPLLGGEFVIAFLAARIALWIWRSHGAWREVLAHGAPGPGGGLPAEPPRLALRLLPPARPLPAEPVSLPRAA
jgi:hypothetical protein